MIEVIQESAKSALVLFTQFRTVVDDFQFFRANAAKVELDVHHGFVHGKLSRFAAHPRLFLVNHRNAVVHFRKHERQLFDVQLFKVLFKGIVTESTHKVQRVLGEFQRLAQFNQNLLVFKARNLRRENFRVVGGITKQSLTCHLHVIDKGFLVFHDLIVHVGQVIVRVSICIVVAVQFLQIRGIGLVEIFLDIGKVNQESAFHILVRAIYTCNCLQQIMIFDFATEIQTLKTRCIKARQQHVEDNQNINRVILLEIVDNLLTGFLVVAIEENQARFQVDFLDAVFIEFVLNLVEELVQISRLFRRFCNNHAAKIVVALHGAELRQIVDDVAEQRLHVCGVPNNHVLRDRTLLHQFLHAFVSIVQLFAVTGFDIFADNL